MKRHAFVDESVRGSSYYMCVTLISSDMVAMTRRRLGSLKLPGQRRIHFAAESDRRRRALLREIAVLKTASVIYRADNRDQITARSAIIKRMLSDLCKAGVDRLVLESRKGQDGRDRSTIHRVSRTTPKPIPAYTHLNPVSEPMLWIPDAVAWAWGRGGRWKTILHELELVVHFQLVNVP